MLILLKSDYILNLQESPSTVNSIMLSYSKKQDRLQLIKVQKFQREITLSVAYAVDNVVSSWAPSRQISVAKSL